MNSRPDQDIDYTKYGWVPPKEQLPSASPSASGDIDYTKYGWVPPESEEGLGTSLAMAVPRVAKDLGVSAFNAMRKTPELFESAKSEVPGLASVIFQQPHHAHKQFNAGLAELLFNTANIPHNLAKYGEERLHLAPHSLQKIIPEWKDEDNQQAINQLFGKPEYAGENLIRGFGRNLPIIGAGAKVASVLNPLKLTENSIAKDVLRAEKENYEKYSGAGGKYDQLQDKAASRGITGQSINPAQKDLAVLKEHMPADEFEAIEKLMKDKNLTNAQSAISQLGFRIRKLIGKSKRGDILSDPEKALLKSAQDTKAHIQENMFKDQAGKVHTDLLNEHKVVQKGYREEVIPYTKNKAIQAHKSGDLLKDQLVKSLMSGKFPANATRIGAHKPLLFRRWIEKHPKTVIGTSLLGAAAGGVPLAEGLYRHLFGNQEGSGGGGGYGQ